MNRKRPNKHVMPIGFKDKKEYETKPAGEDKTPVYRYLIKLSDRDVDALDHLKGRNGAGIGNLTVENIALWKMIDQVCESTEKTPEIEYTETPGLSVLQQMTHTQNKVFS